MLSHLPPFVSRRFARRERGAVLVIVIPALVMTIFACALGVDVGRIAVDKRNDQSVADVAALDAARDLSARSSLLSLSAANAFAQTAARASATRNGFTRSDQVITATVGSINPVTNVFTSSNGNSAVRVIATSILKHAFVKSDSHLTATSIAPIAYMDGGNGCLVAPCANPTCLTPPCAGTGIAEFSVGSTLVGLDTSRSYLDPVLKGWLGAASNLSAVSYDGLASGNVSLGKLQTALLAAGYNVGSVSQLLTTDIKVRDLLTASATALGASTATTEINDLIATNISSTATIKLNQLLNVATPSDTAVLGAVLNVFQLVTGSAELMNGSNFAALTTGASLPNGTTMDASLKVISPAQTAIGPVGTTAENSQGVLKVTLHVHSGLLGSLVDVALTYTLGQAKGTLNSIVCGPTTSSPAFSPGIGVLTTTAATGVVATGTTAITGTLTLSPTSIGASSTQQTWAYNTNTSAWSPSQTQRAPNSTSGLGSTTIGVAGTGNVLVNLILAVLNPLATVISTAVTNATSVLTPALKALGIDVGAADVTALGIYPSPSTCFRPPVLGQ